MVPFHTSYGRRINRICIMFFLSMLFICWSLSLFMWYDACLGCWRIGFRSPVLIWILVLLHLLAADSCSIHACSFMTNQRQSCLSLIIRSLLVSIAASKLDKYLMGVRLSVLVDHSFPRECYKALSIVNFVQSVDYWEHHNLFINWKEKIKIFDWRNEFKYF